MTHKYFKDFALTRGSHKTAEDGLCAMEAVAWLEGLPHSDAPECTCPVIARFLRLGQDVMPDKIRQRLIAYLPRLVGTVSRHHEIIRAEIAVRAAGAEFAWRALLAAGMDDHAAKVREAFLSEDLSIATAVLDLFYREPDPYELELWARQINRVRRAVSSTECACLAALNFIRDPIYAATNASYAAAAASGNGGDDVWDAWFTTLDAMLAAGPHGGGIAPEVQGRVAAYRKESA